MKKFLIIVGSLLLIGFIGTYASYDTSEKDTITGDRIFKTFTRKYKNFETKGITCINYKSFVENFINKTKITFVKNKTGREKNKNERINFIKEYTQVKIFNYVNEKLSCGDKEIVYQVSSSGCNDTDGGNRPYKRGKLSGSIGPGEGSNGWDYCYDGEGTFSTSTGKYLLEWYCTKDGASNQKIYECENGCSAGACVIDKKKEIFDKGSCKDGDGGQNYFVRGTTSDGLTDSCAECDSSLFCTNVNYKTTNLTEYYCYGGVSKAMNYTCPNGCENGACIKNACTDTDLGKDIFVKGRLNALDTKNSNDSCRLIYKNSGGSIQSDPVSSCDGENCHVMELYCLPSNNMGYSEIKCKNGCKDGACIKRDNESKIEIELVSEKSLNILNGRFTVSLWGYDPGMADQDATFITKHSYASDKLPFSFDFSYPSNAIEYIEPKVTRGIPNYYIGIDWDNDKNGKINNGDISFDWDKQFPMVELVDGGKETIYLKQISDF